MKKKNTSKLDISKPAPPPAQPTQAKKDSDSDEESAKPAESLKPTQVVTPTPAAEKKEKVKTKTSKTPFQRVNPNLTLQLDERMRNTQRLANSDWSEKANDVLSKVKGKGFRHEKTKKKKRDIQRRADGYRRKGN